jgi:hypothetical protein
MKVIEIPGIGNVEFPEDMPDDQIAKAISTSMETRREEEIERGIERMPAPARWILRAGGEVEKAVQDPRKYIVEGIDPTTGRPNVVQSALRGALQGATFGYGDEAAAALSSLGPSTMEEETKKYRRKNIEAQAEHPGAYTAGTLGGALAVPLPGAGSAVAGAGAGAKIARGATSGALGGALYGSGLGEGVEGKLKGAASGALLGAGIGGGLSALGQSIGTLAGRAPEALKRFSGERNLKAAGGIQSDLARARKQVGREHLTEAGYEMGQQGLVGPASTPASTFERASESMSQAGQKMRGLIRSADEQIGKTPKVATRLGQVVDKAKREILEPLKLDPHQVDAASKFEGLLDRIVAGEKTPGWTRLPLSKLHEMRMQTDRALYGMRGTQDPYATAYKDALHDFRTMISKEIDDVMERTGVGSPAWRAANRQYEVAARAQELADRGMDRWHGNNLFSPYEVLAGLGAGGAAGAHSGNIGQAGLLGAAGLLGMRLARRHGSGTLGWLGRQGAEATAPLGTPAGRAAMLSGAGTAADVGTKELMALGLVPSPSAMEQERLRQAAATIESIRKRTERKRNATE